uniref:Cell wall protein-like n=1 Tax=Oryza sativa subsp. japonica TaxID=39947 RepID=Q5Z5K9_ORYSJ|nr:cell wall protein-like [Oryza sativa Japonica Group]BAD62045.1 cell wall protein-like [Oryza sativa Japonica Group]
MAPPIAGNGRAKSGRLPLPPAAIPVAVPDLPRGRLPLLSYKIEPPLCVLPFCRLCRLDRAPAGRAVASSSVAATSSTPACPPFRAVTAGGALPPSPFSFLLAGHLQPHLPPRPCTLRPRRHLSRRRSRLLFPGFASVSRGNHRRRVLAGVQWRRHHFSASGRLCRVPGAPADVATTSPGTGVPSSLPARPRRRPNFAGTPSSPRRPLLPPRRLVAPLHHHLHQHRSGVFHAVPSSAQPLLPAIIVSSSSPIVLVVDVPSVARLVVSRRRLRHRHRSGVFHVILVPVQPLPAVLVASSPVPVVVVVVVLSSFPVVVAPVLVFVLGSASSSPVPAASRLRPRIAAEAVPSPFVSVVPVCLRRARSSLSFLCLVAWW